MADAYDVREVEAPRRLRELSTLARVDYQDAFVVTGQGAAHRTPEQWARAMLEAPPLVTRAALVGAWTALGLKLRHGPGGPTVLGWELRRSGPEDALLATESRFGLTGQVLFARDRGALLFSTLVQLDNLVARTVWWGFSPWHRRTVRDLLAAAARRSA